MKYFILILAISLTCVCSNHAQTVLNNGFENINSNNSIKHWGNVYLMSVWIDSNGVSHSDSIIYDGPFYNSTSNAHTGSKALELRNAWNYTTNKGIAGAVGCDEDSIFSGFGPINMVPTNATPFNPFSPFNFGFYYKFSPQNNDSALAEITLWDSSGNQLGQGTIIIGTPTNNYTLINAPLNYTSSGIAAFYSFRISNFYTAAPDVRQPSLGTRLLVDDIGFNFVTNVSSIKEEKTLIYPNPASEFITIEIPANKLFNYCINNISGQTIQNGFLTSKSTIIPLTKLNSGIYYVHIYNDNVNQSKLLKVNK